MDSRLTFKCYGAAVCLWIILVPHCAQAQVVYDLSKLISSSDLVAVAQVANVQQTSSGTVGVPGAKTPIPAHFRIVSLRLQSFLKGKAPPSDVKVPYTILYSPAGWSGGVPQGYTITDTLVPNSIRLVFLRSRGDHYEFTNGSYLSVVCSPESRSEGFSQDVLGRVLSLVAGALFSANVSEQDKAKAIRQLMAVQSDSVLPALRRFEASDAARQSDFLRTEALVALLELKDESVVDLAEGELLNCNTEYRSENLLFAITHVLPPERSIPILAQTLHCASARIRTSAAEAIYGTNSPKGVPALLQALDDPDPQVAFAVMQGLGNLTKQYDWRPKSTKAGTDWFRCLEHWNEFRNRWSETR